MGAIFLYPLDVFSASELRGVNVTSNIDSAGIQVLRSWGVNVVRFSMANNGADNLSLEDYNTWLSEQLSKLDNLLPVFSAANIKVILHLHSPPGGFASRKKPSQFRLFKEAPFQNRFKEIWQEATLKYLNDSRIYAFEILNEPAQREVAAGLQDWNDLYAQVVSDIRTVDADRKVIIQPLYGDIGRLGRLRVLNDPFIIYSVHFYYPFAFTKQGLEKRKKVVLYPNEKLTKRKIYKKLNKVRRFQVKNNISKMFIGEFSVVRWAPVPSSRRYLQHVVKRFEKFDWDWVYHAFRESSIWSLEHGTNKRKSDPVPGTTARLKLFKKFFSKN